MNKMAIHTHVIFRPRKVYFENTFPFVSTFRETDVIRKKRRKHFVEQGIDICKDHSYIGKCVICS